MDGGAAMALEKQLFNDYCYYRGRTAHWQKLKKEKPFLRSLKETPKRLALFSDLVDWCQQKEINPSLWLNSLFAVRRWLFAPRLEKPYLLSEKHVVRFKNFNDYAFYREKQKIEVINEIPKTTFDPNRDISNNAEILKRDLVAGKRYSECLSRQEKETYGYHPLSKVCVLCEIKRQCKKSLCESVTFDIMALREGKITSTAVRAQVMVHAVQINGR